MPELTIHGKSKDYSRMHRVPMTKWMKRNAETGELHTINNTFLNWRKYYGDDKLEPPEGWVRDVNNTRFPRYQSQSQHDRQFFSRAQLKDGIICPLPLRSSRVSATHATDALSKQWEQRLYSSAYLATVYLAERFKNRDNARLERMEARPRHGNLQVSICDSSGTWIGIMDTCFADTDVEVEQVQGACSVIALFEVQFAPWSFYPEAGSHPWLIEEQSYNHVQAMWIEWIGEVAYRKGIGRIHTAAWKQLESKQIDIVLG